jgi:hypothetical protein
MRAHGTDREALTPVAAPRRIKRRKTPTPPKMKAPARCFGMTAARTPPTAMKAPPAPDQGAAALLAVSKAASLRIVDGVRTPTAELRGTRPCRSRMASHTTMRPANTSAIAGTSITTTSTALSDNPSRFRSDLGTGVAKCGNNPISGNDTLGEVKSAELLLHPVRLRIIGAFLGDRKLTTADLRTELPDVPPTSLYRHLGHLIDAGVLDVVSERRVRGTVERTYVPRAAPSVSPGELASWTPDDHRRAFYGYVAALLADFDRYLDQEHVDLRRDGTGYRMAGMWMTDEELNELTRGFVSLLQPYMDNPATPDRRRRILRTIVLLAPDSTESKATKAVDGPEGNDDELSLGPEPS